MREVTADACARTKHQRRAACGTHVRLTADGVLSCDQAAARVKPVRDMKNAALAVCRHQTEPCTTASVRRAACRPTAARLAGLFVDVAQQVDHVGGQLWPVASP